MKLEVITKRNFVIRFVDANKDIREEFLEFKDLERTTGAAVSAVLLATLEALNIPIKDCYGYDGAASMSSERVGVRTAFSPTHQKVSMSTVPHIV